MEIRDVIFHCSVEDVIQELRTQLTINGSPLLQKDPKRSGDSLILQCPFHGNGQEKKPSGGITLSPIKKGNRVIEAGTFHCFACGKVADLPEFISHCFGEDDILGKFGWKWLCKNFLTLQVEERKDVQIDYKRNTSTNENSFENNKDNNHWVSEEELNSYRYYHPYWKQRGITDERLIELFDLGYDKRTQCITMPVRDKSGNTLFVARRSVRTKWFNYPRGVEKTLYGLYELRECSNFPSEIIICESMIDALTCWQFGAYAVAMNGLGTELQFKQLRELPCRELILATDNDEAGRRAREKIRKQVSNKIISEYVIPAGKKDINDLTKEEFLSLEKIF